VNESPAEAEALVERRGSAGIIVLNRPKALNALTLTMVRLTAAALDGWERDPAVTRVLIFGAGEKAFCAGGDIRRLYEFGRAGDHASQLAFWREEYQLNVRFRAYPKPIVALVDGIDMGGGVGVSLNASHMVVGERFMFAMPEVGIGFFPDVGATFFLPRLPHRFGRYFALTGLRAGPGDAVALGMAGSFTPSARFAALAAALEGDAPVEETLLRFAEMPPPSPLLAEAGAIEPCFAGDDREAIVAALAAASAKGAAFAAPALAAMGEKSPTSQAIALRQVTIGGALAFDEAMRTEFRIVSRIARGHDFYEGVRAVLIDKDNAPRWAPPPTQGEVDAYFAPLGSDELPLPGRPH
jgi:enoyl-CoA hydratase